MAGRDGWPAIERADGPCWGRRVAVQSNLFPLAEWRNGVPEKVKRISAPVPVDDHLTLQGRFSHLFGTETGEIELRFLQEIADENARRFGLATATRTKPWELRPKRGGPSQKASR